MDPLDSYMQTLGPPTPQRATWTDAPAGDPVRGGDLGALRVSPAAARRRADVVARNRRFEFAQRRLRGGDAFFGDAAMRERDAALFDELYGSLDPRETPASALERARGACVRAFCERFLDGADDGEDGVDYAAIDADASLDNLDELARDAQERYFATDSESEANEP